MTGAIPEHDGVFRKDYMPDIAMCQDKDCPKRLSCYRYTATPSQYQPYFAEKMVDKKGNCEYYIETEKEK